MQREDGIITFYAKSKTDWRQWLAENHATEKAVWLIIYKKASGVPTVVYKEALEEALCYGWIDSKINKRDADSYFQYFAKRNPKSNWSRVNKQLVEKLLSEERMEQSGLDMVALAKHTGTWDALNEVENGVIPEDLGNAFAQYSNARQNFETFPRSVKRGILEWILNAKRPATREKRIQETARLAQDNIRANQYRQ